MRKRAAEAAAPAPPPKREGLRPRAQPPPPPLPPRSAAQRRGAPAAPPAAAGGEGDCGAGPAAGAAERPTPAPPLPPLAEPPPAPAPHPRPVLPPAPLWTRSAEATPGVAGLCSLATAGSAAGALVLPADAPHPHALDDRLCARAKAEGAIPDGNCLSHACSLGVWGVPDDDAALRTAVAATMASPGAGAQVRCRFEHALRRLGIPPDGWGAEWGRETAVFAGPLRGGRGPPALSRGFLGDVHCFVLANVLRRPLVIYGGAAAMAAGLAGVFLPLLWEAPQPPGGGGGCGDGGGGARPAVPTSLLYRGSHFSVLATVGAAGGRLPLGVALPATDAGGGADVSCAPAAATAEAAPLCAVPLPVRFLLPEEEGSERRLLAAWMPLVPQSTALAGVDRQPAAPGLLAFSVLGGQMQPQAAAAPAGCGGGGVRLKGED